MLPHPWNTDFEWQRRPVVPRRLGTAEIDRFHDEGWLVLDDLVEPDTIRALTDELDEIEGEVDELLRSLPDERMFIAEAGAITFSPHAVVSSAAARTVSRHPAIVDVCHDLLGPDVRLYWDQLVYKSPAKPRQFPWHQDNGYTFVEPQQYLTVWLALTDTTVDNGCPWVVPGCHTRGTLAHHYVDPLGHRCFATSDDAIAAPVRAGGAVVFSSLTPHMTGPNTTGTVRKAYILQYAPDGAEVLEGKAGDGPPTARVIQNDPSRQYAVLCNGEPVVSPS